MSLALVTSTTILDASAGRGTYAAELGRIVWPGSSSGGFIAVTSDDGGATWTGRGSGVASDTADIAWAPSLPLFVAVTNDGVVTSPDGETWSADIILSPYFFPQCVAWSPALNLFVVGGVAYSAYYGHPPDHFIWTSPNGVTWTGRTMPGTLGSTAGVAWSPTLNLFAIACEGGQVGTSPDGITWTFRAHPISNFGFGMRWLANSGVFVVMGESGTNCAASSPDGITWTALTNPFGSFAQAYDVAEMSGIWYMGGNSIRKAFQSSDQGASWTQVVTQSDGTTDEVRGMLTVPAFNTVYAGVKSLSSTSQILAGVPPVMPPPVRFYEGYDWRWVVANLSGATMTFLDPLAMNRQITFQLNDAATATCELPSDNPEINILNQDGDPFVSNANRILYAFRREAPGTADPWVCRFAGVIEELNDEITVDTDAPVTHLTAYDPWHYLDSMPVVDNVQASLGLLPGQGGVTFPANGVWTPATIVVTLIENTVLHNVAESNPMPKAAEFCFIDTRSGHVPPNITDPTAPIAASVNFQQGMTVGDALRQMVTDGLCDIILTPIYPMNTSAPSGNDYYRIATLNVYALAGSDRNAAVFAWDKPGNSLVGLNRLENATSMGNHVMLAAGTAGTPVVANPNAQSTQKFGPYWYLDSVTGKVAYPLIVKVLAQAQVAQRAYGQPTITIDPATERSPIALIDYGLGDNVPVYASSRFRESIAPILNDAGTAWKGLGRVWTIPITMPDDAPETITQLTLQIFPVQPTPVVEHLENIVAVFSNAVDRAGRRVVRSKLKKPFTG